MAYQRTKEQRHAEYLRSKDKCLVRAKEWALKNPDKRKEILDRWNKKSGEYKRIWAQKKDFGITVNLDNCILCGSQDKLVVPHRDGNNGRMGKVLNNDPNNLVVLCRSCHPKVHSHGKIKVLV